MNAEVQIDEPNEPAHIESQTTTALAVVTQSITEINAFEAGITELERQYKGMVFEVSTTAGMDEACKARLAIRKPRYAIQKLAKEAKATLNNLKSGIDEQAEGYITRIGAVEDPVHEQIENELKRKAAIKEAARVAELARIDGIHERINEIRESVTLAAGSPSETIQEMIAVLVALPIDESFAEFKQRAETAKEATLARLRAVYNNALAVETEQKRLADERAELARQKAAEEVRLAQERERLAEEQRQAKKAVDAEAARQADQLRRQREEQEAEAARVKAVQDARDAEAAEQQRRQDEESERARERNEMAMQEISAIHHQLMIADVGRAPYCKGGDLHSFDWVIEQTELWEITTEKFGVLAGSAQKVKDSTLANLRKGRADLVKRLQEEENAQVERDRLAAARADLERQQEALRLERETTVAPTDPVEATDGELLSSATLFGDVASAQLPPEPDAPSVDEAILTTLDALSMQYNLDDARGRELIVRMGLRVAELSE